MTDAGRPIDAGAREHYSDAAYYALAYRKRTEDVAFYERLVAELRPANVLECGAGNGRITLPLARAGVAVTALDASAAMLDDLRARVQREPKDVAAKVRTVHGDMRARRFRQKFALVMAPFNTVLHLYTRNDFEQFLACARANLAEGGALVFDYSLPRVADLALDPERWFRGPRFRHPTHGGMVGYAERFHYAPITQVLSTWMEFSPVDGSPAWQTRLTHRQYFPQEIMALLHYNGFVEQRWTADFADKPLSAQSDVAVVVCRRGSRRSDKSR